MFQGGFHMIRKISLTASLLGSALLLSGCVTPYVSGTVGTQIGRGGYVSGTVGGYPYGYGGYNRYGYGGSAVYGYDRYGNPIYRLPDGRLVVGSNYNRGGYDRYNGGYPGYSYPGYGYRNPSYGYPSYGYPGYGYPGGYYRPPTHSHRPPPVTRPGGDSGVPSRPVSSNPGGSSSGSVLRQARERMQTKQASSGREATSIEP